MAHAGSLRILNRFQRFWWRWKRLRTYNALIWSLEAVGQRAPFALVELQVARLRLHNIEAAAAAVGAALVALDLS